MPTTTLTDVIEEECQDAEFKQHFQRELLINEIAKLILQLRQRATLTQKELAYKAKTTQPVIARLEKGSDSRDHWLCCFCFISEFLLCERRSLPELKNEFCNFVNEEFTLKMLLKFSILTFFLNHIRQGSRWHDESPPAFVFQQWLVL